MLLSFDTRQVGDVTVVRCKGRIVSGQESESLRTHVNWLLHDRRLILMYLCEVGFIDSSGLGTMVRALASTRQARGELKLCNVPETVRKVLEMTRLITVFDLYDSEEKAILAFYRSEVTSHTPIATGRSILCLDSNIDVLAYLRELLRRAGYDVQSTNLVSDARLLLRVTKFDLLLVGPAVSASPAVLQGFRDASAKVQVLELGSDFSTQDAGHAGAELLKAIESRLT